jgi:hypothetical protein
MISFVTGIIGKSLLIGGLGVLTVAGAYAYGYVRGSATVEYKVKYAQAVADKLAVEKELENLEYIHAAQAKLAEEWAKRAREDEKRLAAMEDYIASLPAIECPLPPDWLRNLPGEGD